MKADSAARDVGRDIDALTLVYLDDFEAFCEDQLKIKAKSGEVIPFHLNSAQRLTHELLEIQRKAFGLVRALCLKGRQQGISTYIEGRFFHRVTFEAGLRAYILTHEQAATDTIFEMADRYYQHVDQPWRHGTTAANAKELRFSSDAGYQVATAGTKAAGRSKTVQLFHGSEVAFWPAAETHAAGVIQAVPLERGTEIILESTANGTGGYYHAKWSEAWTILQDRYNGDIRRMAREHLGYIPIFVPWFLQAEYRLEEGDPLVLTEEEAKLAARHGLHEAQLRWRRNKITELSNPDLFRQEYPCTPEEAFLHSGRPFFPQETQERIRATVRPPAARGVLQWDRSGVVFKEQSNGWLRVWDKPDDDEEYVLGADVSEGLDEPADRSACDVLMRGLVVRQVAQIIPAVEPDEFGRQCVLAAEWYNGRGWLGIERNAMGIAAVNAARDTGYPYIYKMHRGEGQVGEDIKTPRFGWLTNVASRPVLCNDLLAALRDGALEVRSQDTAAEVASFVVRDGKPEASEGCRDDCVISLGIAWQMATRTQPNNREGHVSSSRTLPRGRTGWMV